MAIAEALYSSRSEEWETPPEFYAELDREFHFSLDACATRNNTKHPHCWITPEEDSLLVDWSRRTGASKAVIWCNPPYGRHIGKWFAKARTEAARGCTVVMLAHARTDTIWWHEHVQGIASEVRFVKGRLRFLNESKRQLAGAPFPSAVIIYRPTGIEVKQAYLSDI